MERKGEEGVGLCALVNWRHVTVLTFTLRALVYSVTSNFFSPSNSLSLIPFTHTAFEFFANEMRVRAAQEEVEGGEEA